MNTEEKEEAQRLIERARDSQMADDICNAMEYMLERIWLGKISTEHRTDGN